MTASERSACSMALGLLAIVLPLSTTAHAGGVAILNTVLSDDGDHDGYADTNETVSMQLTVRNTSGIALSAVKLRLASLDPQRVCLSDAEIEVGDLAPGQTVVPADTFVFAVLDDVDRAGMGLGPWDALSATFEIHAFTAASEQPALASTITLDLDLNVSGGAGPMSFFESFEDTLGAFEIENIDQGKTNLADSDGYRCQYHDPDWPNSNNYGHETGPECFLGNTPLQADKVHWGLSGPAYSPLGGRGFSGFHSLFFGIDLGPPENWTTPMGTLEAVRTTDPIALGWAGTTPFLHYVQQVSFVDSRTINADSGEASDRGVVMVQLADNAGNPIGPWIKVEFHQNTYDQTASDNFFGCMYDPIDDGNTEDDFFDPTDPARRLGPSSVCLPAGIFANMGETSSPFGAANLGRADGPGLEGQWGIGTWIESRADLSRFRGRQVRLRFLATAIKYPPNVDDWELFFPGLNPDPGDDGWWIDNVTIEGALVQAAAVSLDLADNSGLPGAPGGDADGDGSNDVCDNCAVSNPEQDDADGDGAGDLCDPCPAQAFVLDPDFDMVCGELDNCPLVNNPAQGNVDGDPAGDACDCNDLNAKTYPGAAEWNDGQDNQCPGEAGYGIKDEISGLMGFYNAGNKNELSWPAQGGATRYQVGRASSGDFMTGCVTLPFTTAPLKVDIAQPAAGQAYYYLVRSVLPNVGSWGQDSAGVERNLPCD